MEEDCKTCKFNIGGDDDEARCELLKMLGKSDPTCDKYESKDVAH